MVMPPVMQTNEPHSPLKKVTCCWLLLTTVTLVEGAVNMSHTSVGCVSHGTTLDVPSQVDTFAGCASSPL